MGMSEPSPGYYQVLSKYEGTSFPCRCSEAQHHQERPRFQSILANVPLPTGLSIVNLENEFCFLSDGFWTVLSICTARNYQNAAINLIDLI